MITTSGAGGTRARTLAGAAAVVAAAVAIASCGGTGKAAGTDAPTAPTSATADSTPAPSATSLQDRFVAVIGRVSPAVVEIRTDAGLGSGVVFDGRGDVVTNAHVVAGARTATVRLHDGRRVRTSLVGVSRNDDLAVIRMAGASPSPARFADSTGVRVGDLAIAIGNPLGLASSVTQGIVSSVGRQVSEGNGVTLESAIQTSADINPGNSGGALVDLDGAVIGIPTLTALDPDLGGAQAPGIGFAIDSNHVTQVAKQIIASHGG
jgi:S1-C subfamily serine protease